MKRPRQVMLLAALAAIFAAPFVLALALYHDEAWRPHGLLQHGELLLPLQPLVPPALTTIEGAPLDASLFRGHWTLLYSSGDHCDAGCRQLLTTLQNVRLAQGEAMTQVRRVLVLAKSPHASDVHEPASSDLQVATAAHWPLPATWVYLLDPQGNMVMRYQPGFEPRGLLLDLQRLLRRAGTE